MRPIKLVTFLVRRMIAGLVCMCIWKFFTKIIPPFSIPASLMFLLCLSYAFMAGGSSRNPPSNSGPDGGLTEVKKELYKVEELLQAYGSLIQQTGIVCRDTFKQIYKEQREHLRQYNDFRKQYVDQFGSIVNVLEGHRKDIAENSRVAKEQNTSLCNIIGQYRKNVEDNQNIVLEHIDSVTTALKAQYEASERNQELVEERNDSIRNTLQNQSKLIEDNTKLIREHGKSIDSVVSDHANLVAEYQKALDGVALLITANRIFNLMHEASDWESLGDHAGQVDAKGSSADDKQELSQGHEKPIMGPDLDIASANVVDNVQEIARTFRDRHTEKNKAMEGKPVGRSQRARIHSRANNNTKVEYPGWQPVSGIDQLMATVFDQFKTTLQNTVEAQHAEEMRQIRQGLEDMEKLRADLGEIQKIRQEVREVQAGSERMEQQDREIRTMREEIRRLRSELSQQVRDEVDQKIAGFESTTTATSNFINSTDGDTATAATVTDPTGVTFPGPVPTAGPTDDDNADVLGAFDHEADDDATDDEADGPGEGRLLGDFLGRLLAREDWPDKKKTRRKTRKMYAMARQRAEEKREE